MTIDAFGILFSIAVYVLFNRWGWGILHDPIYISGLIATGLIYTCVSLFHSHKALWARIIVALVLGFLTAILPTISNIQSRQNTLAYGFVNDSALQIEIAGRYILLGINPYSESYEQTDLAKWEYHDDAGNSVNPALYNNVHPPLLLLVSALEYRVFSQLLGWSDIRVIYIVAYIALLLLAWKKFGATEHLVQFLAFGALNPLFTTYMAQGTNDVVVLALLLWSLYLLEQKKALIIGGIFFGLALATKQTAWVAIPFIVSRLMVQPIKMRWMYALSTGITAFVCYLPFALWNFGALMNSLIFYISANVMNTNTIHPIEGIGFSPVLRALGVVPTIYSSFPFWILQICALGVVWMLYRFVKKSQSIKHTYQELFFIALGTTVVWFFSKYFLQSHLGYITTLFGCAYVWEHHQTGNEKNSH